MTKKVSGQDNEEEVIVAKEPVVALLEENFSNGEINTLRDKINELIKAVS